VHLRLGKLTAVVPDYLAFSFRAAVEGTPLAGVEVAWEDVPVRGLCLACGETSEFSAVGFLCLTCGSPRVQITAGRELLIDSLEVDEDGP
jgi:hydrogenase nickel incorporation protein HypA/HybF